MRHIKDICPLVKEVRQRIVEIMQERGISEVQFIPSEDEWLEQNPDKYEEDYYDLREEVCPYIVHFDKYGCGYEYRVTKVLLIGKDHLGFPLFKLECEASEIGSATFLDTDVYDMTWVYEMLEKALGMDNKPEKVKCAVVFGTRATRRYDEQDFEGLHEACRDGDGSIVIREFDTEAERKAFIEGIEAGDGWCDYMEVDPTDIENVTFDDI